MSASLKAAKNRITGNRSKRNFMGRYYYPTQDSRRNWHDDREADRVRRSRARGQGGLRRNHAGARHRLDQQLLEGAGPGSGAAPAHLGQRAAGDGPGRARSAVQGNGLCGGQRHQRLRVLYLFAYRGGEAEGHDRADADGADGGGRPCQPDQSPRQRTADPCGCAVQEYYSKSQGGMNLRSRQWIVALVAASMIVALPARAQQPQPQEPTPGQSLPERFVNDLGSAIRGIFESIFGGREGEQPAPQSPPQPSQPEPPPKPQVQDPVVQKAAKPAADSALPAAVSPSAQAAPQSLHAVIAKGDYTNALKMIEQGADIEAKDPGAGASALHYAVM